MKGLLKCIWEISSLQRSHLYQSKTLAKSCFLQEKNQPLFLSKQQKRRLSRGNTGNRAAGLASTRSRAVIFHHFKQQTSLLCCQIPYTAPKQQTYPTPLHIIHLLWQNKQLLQTGLRLKSNLRSLSQTKAPQEIPSEPQPQVWPSINYALSHTAKGSSTLIYSSQSHTRHMLVL